MLALLLGFSGQTCPKKSFCCLALEPSCDLFLVNYNIRIISNDIEGMDFLFAAVSCFDDALLVTMA